MALPLQINGLVGQALVGAHVYTLADLGIATTLLSGASGIASKSFNTGIPATTWVIAKNSSGTNYVVLNATSSSALNFAGATWTLVGSTGNFVACTVDTTTANSYVSLAIVDNGANSIQGTLLCMVLAQTTAGENWNSVNSGMLACASLLRGDGSGVVPKAVA